MSRNVVVADNSTSTVSEALSQAVSKPTISTVSPNTGYNNGYITGVTITGTGFIPGATDDPRTIEYPRV
ncbi:MAG: hypothetical protein METHP_01250 [Methanoregula sp. SKADARSKE-2]|nr:MAG: hypothetical protein METHP_01250 [Methanoregula sp. SKADARSKE-2]